MKAKIIPFTPAVPQTEEEEELHINVTFISLDDYRTALVGEFAAIRPLIEQLGTITERKQIYDPQGNNRGPGVILSVFQTMKLVNLMEEEGWDDMNPDVRRVAEARYNALIQITYK